MYMVDRYSSIGAGRTYRVRIPSLVGLLINVCKLAIPKSSWGWTGATPVLNGGWDLRIINIVTPIIRKAFINFDGSRQVSIEIIFYPHSVNSTVTAEEATRLIPVI